MLSRLIDTSGWSHEQWLAACILVFAVLSLGVFLHRIMKLFRMTTKQRYQPNLRPLRRKRIRPTSESEDRHE